MQVQATAPLGAGEEEIPTVDRARWRARRNEVRLRNALAKRSAGVPSYTVPEAAALLSVSAEHMYRLVRGDAFPAVRMSLAHDQGRYVVPAAAVEQLLQLAAETGRCIDGAAWATDWHANHAGAAAPGGQR